MFAVLTRFQAAPDNENNGKNNGKQYRGSQKHHKREVKRGPFKFSVHVVTLGVIRGICVFGGIEPDAFTVNKSVMTDLGYGRRYFQIAYLCTVIEALIVDPCKCFRQRDVT